MANRRACIIAGGMCKWGVREASYKDMVQEAAKECLEDLPGLKPTDIDGLIFASTFVGRRSCQTNTAPVVAEVLGLKPSSICVRIDVLCAGGSTGIILATGLVESGRADIVMVAGCEKLYTPERWQVQYDENAAIDHDWDGPNGVGPPPLWFSLIAQEYVKHYRAKWEDIASVSVVNYEYGSNNPKAHFNKKLTLEEAINAKEVALPLRLYDCCPLTDGADAAIIACEEKAKQLTNRPLVYIRGTAQLSLNSATANWPGEHLGDWVHLRMAAEKVYKSAKMSPKDIDVAQVHDCFSISQAIELEEIGFCKKGEGAAFVASGETKLTGKIPTNTDGGLLSCGHPFGATGIRQGIEIMRQLQGRATNQVKGATTGLTHNLSGANVEHTLLIYSLEPLK